MPHNFTIVEFMPEDKGHSCGYCKSRNTNISQGMWAHTMTVHDYQDLIDLGWRRSGQYCYKPSLKVTCCPQYTIRCNTLELKLTKSQKKVAKKVHKFLAEGCKNEIKDKLEDSNLGESAALFVNDIPNLETIALKAQEHIKDVTLTSEQTTVESPASISGPSKNQSQRSWQDVATDCGASTSKPALKVPRSGIGQDFSKPQCKKAKLIRLERKKERLAEKGEKQECKSVKKVQTHEKTIEDFLNEPLPLNPAHQLELRLLGSSEVPHNSSFDEELSVYQKYQTAIHHDPPSKCSKLQFVRFLVSSPLKAWKDSKGVRYGSFHQQYWLDGRLIAVGVIDILPKCVSSVYFFYDPDYSHLSLGTYGSLRELSLTRSLSTLAPELQFYYMGFYIHSCPKMRYKAKLQPSFLLCPEMYTWIPVAECTRKLDESKYSKLDYNEGPGLEEPELGKVLVLWNHTTMPYFCYKLKNPTSNDSEVLIYAKLVGKTCAERMLLFRE